MPHNAPLSLIHIFPLKPTFEAEAAVTAENLKAYLPFDHVYTLSLIHI